jgi:hypothetical protein
VFVPSSGYAEGEDLHWLAGLLEGEGSFFPGAPSSPHLPVIQITMADEDVIKRVAQMFQRSMYTVPPRREGWLTTYGVRVKGSGAVVWMRKLRPLLGLRRRAQVDRAIASYAPRSRQLLDDARAIVALDLLARGESVRAVAARFGTSIWCIYDLRLGRTHKHVQRAVTARERAAGSTT